MKLVNRKMFLQLPEGTVFQKYSPKSFQDLLIKTGDFYTNDFRADSPIGQLQEKDDEEFFDVTDRLENGEEIPCHFYTSFRDGFFDEEQMFAIWSKEDIEGLIERLQKTIQ